MRIKILSLLATMALSLSLTACPSQETKSTSDQQATQTEAPAVESTTATTAESKESSEEHSEESAEMEVASMAGNPENGAKVFMGKTCNVCHKVSTLEGAVGALGPVLDGIGTQAATRKAGLDAMAYLKESIEKPDAYLVEGYQNIMTPGLKEQMNDEEYQDLLAYLMSLKS